MERPLNRGEEGQIVLPVVLVIAMVLFVIMGSLAMLNFATLAGSTAVADRAAAANLAQSGFNEFYARLNADPQFIGQVAQYDSGVRTTSNQAAIAAYPPTAGWAQIVSPGRLVTCPSATADCYHLSVNYSPGTSASRSGTTNFTPPSASIDIAARVGCNGAASACKTFRYTAAVRRRSYLNYLYFTNHERMSPSMPVPLSSTYSDGTVHAASATQQEFWHLTLDASNLTPLNGQSVNYTLSANNSLVTPYELRIVDTSNGAVLATCATGSSCSATLSETNSQQSIVGQLWNASTAAVVTNTSSPYNQIQTGPLTTTWAAQVAAPTSASGSATTPWHLSLSTSTNLTQDGTAVTLTLTSNPSTTNTDYFLQIVDQTNSSIVASFGGTGGSTTVTETSPTTQTYVGELVYRPSNTSSISTAPASVTWEVATPGQWQYLNTAPPNWPASGATTGSFVYDAAAGEMVALAKNHDVYTWTPNAWATTSLANPQSFPLGAGNWWLGYDSATSQLIAVDTNGYGATTYLWNGLYWQYDWNGGVVMTCSSGSPQATVSWDMGYDSTTGQVVAVATGAQNATSPCRETYTWNPSADTWSHVAGANAPTAKRLAVLAPSAPQQQLLTSSSSTSPYAAVQSTWNGSSWPTSSTWTLTTPYANVAYDYANGKWMVVMGNHTYQWINGAWSQLLNAATPQNAYGLMSYDPATSQLLFLTDSNGLYAWNPSGQPQTVTGSGTTTWTLTLSTPSADPAPNSSATLTATSSQPVNAPYTISIIDSTTGVTTATGGGTTLTGTTAPQAAGIQRSYYAKIASATSSYITTSPFVTLTWGGTPIAPGQSTASGYSANTIPVNPTPGQRPIGNCPAPPINPIPASCYPAYQASSGFPAPSQAAFDGAMSQLRPWGWWKLGDTSGTTMTDSSGNGHNGTYRSGALGQTGPWPGSVAVGKPYGTVSTPSVLWMGFSVNAWVYPSANGYVAAGTTSSGVPWSILVNNGVIQFSVSSGGGAATAQAPIQMNSGWYYVSGVYNGSRLTLYLDGSAISSAIIPIPSTVAMSGVIVGGGTAAGTQAETAVFNYPLNATDEQTLWWAAVGDPGASWATTGPATQDVVNGPIHTNGPNIWTCGDPIFKGTVEAAGPKVSKPQWAFGCYGTQPTFNGTPATVANAPQIALPTGTQFSQLQAIAGPQYSFTGTTTITASPNGLTINGAAYPYPASGVVYVSGQANVSGVVKGGLTIAATGDIVITNNLTYSCAGVGVIIGGAGSSCTGASGASPDVTGLITESNIQIAYSPSGLTVDAALMAINGTIYTQGWNTNMVPPTGAPVLTFNGAMVSNFRSVIGAWYGNTGQLASGYQKDFAYDTRLLRLQPPWFINPLAGAWSRISLSSS